MPPWMIFTSFSVNLLFQYWVHTERIDRMPKWFELILNTPSHHRVHHSSDKEYIDKNYAGILIIWDRLFGSYVEETFRPKYGLTKNVDSYNPFKLQYHEYASIVRDVRSATRLRDKLGYIFGPPGWEPTTPADTAAPVPAPAPEPVAV
jgi:sterol desaturase/sphingolipid hydroxylase (fatty acid hydroxylase superfamily)